MSAKKELTIKGHHVVFVGVEIAVEIQVHLPGYRYTYHPHLHLWLYSTYLLSSFLLSPVFYSILSRNKRYLIKNTFILDILLADIVDCCLCRRSGPTNLRS